VLRSVHHVLFAAAFCMLTWTRGDGGLWLPQQPRLRIWWKKY